MRPQRSRWLAWLSLAFAVLGGTFSFLGLAMVSSLSQNRTAALIYSGTLVVMILLGLGALLLLVRAYRRPRIGDDRNPS